MTPKQDGPPLEQYLETRFDLLTTSLQDKLDAADLRYQQRFEAQSKALEAAFQSQQQAMQTALAAAKEAVVAAMEAANRAVQKAEMAADKRFEGVNEFRATLADQQRTLMPRSEVDVLFRAMNDRLTALKEIVDARASERRGVSGGYGNAVAIIGLIATVLAILAWIASRFGG